MKHGAMSREGRQDTPQARALAHITRLSKGTALDPALRVTVHFHPDRLIAGVPILDAMARDGTYRSQFETGTSNGGLTAHPGGARWRWESRIFAGAYDAAPPSERPKYGALNFRGRSLGGSPRFGSAYLKLTGELLARTTFCYPDSVFEPARFGTAAQGAALIETALADSRDALDDYIEAHVHGPLLLTRDVEAIVLDPCYRGTEVEQAALRIGCPVAWHAGFRLSVDVLQRHPDYRGPQYVALGLRLSEGGFLNPRIIGDAARTGRHDEQDLKRLWHYVARFGAHEIL